VQNALSMSHTGVNPSCGPNVLIQHVYLLGVSCGGSDFEAFLEGEEEFEDGFDWSDDEEVSRFSIGIFGASHL
jgi:hypothetical protein